MNELLVVLSFLVFLRLVAFAFHMATRKVRPACAHRFVEGFGAMGNAVVCAKCGLDKYPKYLSVEDRVYLLSAIKKTDPTYGWWKARAKEARARRRGQEQLE